MPSSSTTGKARKRPVKTKQFVEAGRPFEGFMAVDPEKVEWLVEEISEVIVEALEGNPTSHSEVVSALFTILDRCLSTIRRMPPSDDKLYNTALINQTLLGMMIEQDRTIH